MTTTATQKPKTAQFNTIREALARLLAKENITVIQDPKAPSAYFDLKNRTLALPVWKGMTDAQYDMLIGHETGHALFTPNGNGGWVDTAKAIAADAGFAGDLDAIRSATSIINIVEDARIERLVKEMYPGLRRDFHQAYTEFHKNDIFGLKGRNPNTLGLADRLNLHYKIGFVQPIRFTAQESVFVQRMDAARSWEDVVQIARDLFDYQSNPQTQPNDPQDGEDGDQVGEDQGESQGESQGEAQGEGEGEGNPQGSDGKGKGDDQGEGDQGEGDAQGEGDGEAQGEAHGEGKAQGEGEEKPGTASRTKQNTRGNNQAPVKPGVPETADALDRASAGAADRSAKGRNYLTLDQSFRAADHIIGYRQFLDAHRQWESALSSKSKELVKRADEKIADMIADTKASVTAFAREFEMRKTADEHRRTVESKTGRLDMDQAWKYRISDNLFRTATTMRDGKNHGFVLFIDWSGSMGSNMEQTLRQLFMLFQFCKKVGVPFDVYAFGFGIQPKTGSKTPGELWFQDTCPKYDMKGKENVVAPQTTLLHVLSSRMSQAELKDAFRYCMIDGCAYYDWNNPAPCALGGSTPLDNTILLAAQIVSDFKVQAKVQIVNTVILTDGDATDYALRYSVTKSSGWNAINVFRDNFKEYVQGAESDTQTLLRWLKDRVGGNIIGVFVASNLRYASHYLGTDAAAVDAAQKQFKKEGWCSTKAAGFTEYFILSGTVRDQDGAMQQFGAADASGKTATALRNEFIKAVKATNANRGMIQRFVSLIA